jgi:hypothetical protein
MIGEVRGAKREREAASRWEAGFFVGGRESFCVGRESVTVDRQSAALRALRGCRGGWREKENGSDERG